MSERGSHIFHCVPNWTKVQKHLKTIEDSAKGFCEEGKPFTLSIVSKPNQSLPIEKKTPLEISMELTEKRNKREKLETLLRIMKEMSSENNNSPITIQEIIDRLDTKKIHFLEDESLLIALEELKSVVSIIEKKDHTYIVVRNGGDDY